MDVNSPETTEKHLNEVSADAAKPNVPNPNDELLRRNPSSFPNLRIKIPTSSFSTFDGSSGYSPSRLQLRPPWPSLKRAAANPFSRQNKRRQGAGNVRIDDFSGGTGSDSDEAVEHYGGEENRAIERPEQSSRSMSEETVSSELEEEPQKVFTHTVTSWSNGFTVDDSSLKTLDDPENATFLEIISSMESPRELGQVRVQVKIISREEENYTESQAGSDSASTKPPPALAMRAKESAIERSEQSSKVLSGETDSAELQEQQQEDQPYEVVTYTVTIWRNGFTVDDDPFKSLDDPENAAFLEYMPEDNKFGVPTTTRSTSCSSQTHQELQTLAGSESTSTEPPLTTTQPPSMSSLVVDPAAPTTSIPLILADSTRIVTQFNTHHTIRDIRCFIDTSRPDGSKDYQLLIMGSPPTPLSDFDQTIEKAGIANSVLVQKF
ncbi:unnamed protein product [Arabidopsis thaliana]|uniref:UBX domain-containing protein n=1 Tax=Arabidopsis thaliana TaxID=3702 RepID=A0A654F9G8_ARATH|nr:unnamed protein product [Arabidopsis thaliana]